MQTEHRARVITQSGVETDAKTRLPQGASLLSHLSLRGSDHTSNDLTSEELTGSDRTGREVLSPDEVETLMQAQQALEADPDFARLQALLRDFNLFEALGMVRQELRHSHWLAFLLHPGRSHQLGGALLHALCQDKQVAKHLDRALKDAARSRIVAGSEVGTGTTALATVQVPSSQLPSSRRTVRDWDWGGAVVVRESEDLDLLVVDPQLGLALIIENKIDTGEHDDQLARYYERVGERYPDLAIAGLYLTPQGAPPSDKRYLGVSYLWVCRAVESLLAGLGSGASSVGASSPITTPQVAPSTKSTTQSSTRSMPQAQDALALLLEHYIHLLRRHIVDHPELPQLCSALYARHAPLLDLLFEHRGDDETRLYRAVQALVQQGAGPRSPEKLVAKSPRKTIYPKFGLREWEALSTQASGGEALDRSALYFEFTLRGALRLSLLIGPTYPDKASVDALRGRVLLVAQQSPHLFTSGPFKARSSASRPTSPLDEATKPDGDTAAGSALRPQPNLTPNPTTTILWRQTWISPKRFEALGHEEIVAELERRWAEFLATDLLRLRAALPAQALRPAKANSPKGTSTPSGLSQAGKRPINRLKTGGNDR